MMAGAERGLLLVSHGSRLGITVAEQTLARHARRISAGGAFAEVATATLFGGPGPAAALERMRSQRVCVVPVLMSDGAHVREVLPQLLNGAGSRRRTGLPAIRISPPVGLAPTLADLMVTFAEEEFRLRNLDPSGGTVLVVGHGSTRDTASRAAMELQADRVVSAGRFAAVQIAYLVENPQLEVALDQVPGPAVLVAVFAAAGLHGGIEIRDAVALCGRRDLFYAGPLGEDDRFADVLADCADERETQSEQVDSIHS